MKPIIIDKLESYEYPVFSDLNVVQRNINRIMEKLPQLLDFDDKIQLFFRGSSGLTISMYLADAMLKAGYKNVKMCFIRKENENSHSSNPYPWLGYKIIIVDDFVSSGATIRTILEYISKQKTYNPDATTYSDSYFKAEYPNIVGFICKGITFEFDPIFDTLPNLKFVIE